MRTTTTVGVFLGLLFGASGAFAGEIDLDVLRDGGGVRLHVANADLADLDKLAVFVVDGGRECAFTLSEPRKFRERRYYCAVSSDAECPDLGLIASTGKAYEYDTKAVPIGEVVDGFYVRTGTTKRVLRKWDDLVLELVRSEDLPVLKASVCSVKERDILYSASESGIAQRPTGLTEVSYNVSEDRLKMLRGKVIATVSVPTRD